MVTASEQARLPNGVSVFSTLPFYTGMATDITEDIIHAEETVAGADARIVIVGHGMKERHTPTFVQNLIISRRE